MRLRTALVLGLGVEEEVHDDGGPAEVRHRVRFHRLVPLLFVCGVGGFGALDKTHTHKERSVYYIYIYDITHTHTHTHT